MQLIAIDMDGTLLHDDNYISQKQVDYLLELIAENRAEIVITTGRPLAGIKNLLPKELYEKVYRIALNGSLIQSPEDEIIQVSSLKYDDVLELVRFSKDYNTDVSLLDKHKFYSLSENITDLMSYDASLNKMEMEYFNIQNLKELDHITKLLIFSNPDRISQLRTKTPTNYYDKYSVIFSQKYLIEFLPKGIDKGQSLLKLASTLDLPKSSIISIGDGLNDQSMLEVAEIAIAMENAEPSIIEIADIVSTTNNNNGVKYALERIGL